MGNNVFEAFLLSEKSKKKNHRSVTKHFDDFITKVGIDGFEGGLQRLALLR